MLPQLEIFIAQDRQGHLIILLYFSIPLSYSCFFFKSTLIIHSNFFPFTGSNTGPSTKSLRARRSEHTITPQKNPRMGQILQEPFRWFRPAIVDRRHPLLHRIFHPSWHFRRAPRRQCKYW